ncbi:MAG: phosphoribosylglycinamide formyltransferase [Clostridia bacterium]|nr:phosphoribosylglycinamide formyltransferase [Clostridia bacterium]
MLKKIAVFASGGGTDFQSIIDANDKEGFCKIEYLVASKPNIGAIDRAQKAGIKTLVYDKAKGEGIAAFYRFLTEVFKREGIDYLILAGWLLIIPADFIASFEDRILNIHPALIPSFCGKGFYGLKVHAAALEYGVKLSGATVHFVEADVDGGAIVMQRAVEVFADDTPESLQARVLAVEHEMLPLCVKLLCEGRIEKKGRIVRIIREEA